MSSTRSEQSLLECYLKCVLRVLASGSSAAKHSNPQTSSSALYCVCVHKMDSNVPWNWMQNASQTKGFSLAWVVCKCIKSSHSTQSFSHAHIKKINLLSCSKLNVCMIDKFNLPFDIYCTDDDDDFELFERFSIHRIQYSEHPRSVWHPIFTLN